MALDTAPATPVYAEGALSQVAFRGGVWWHWHRLPILGAWVPVAGTPQRKGLAGVPRVTALPPQGGERLPMAPVAVMPGDAGGAR